MRIDFIEQGPQVVAEYMRERAVAVPGIAMAMPYLIAAELIRSMTYAVSAVPAADIRVVLDGLDLAVRS